WAREDRWREVAGVLAARLQAAPPDPDVVGWLALAQLKAGDRAGHAALCRAVLRSLPPRPSPGLAASVAELCVLSPGALDDWSVLLGPLQEAVRAVEAAEGRAEGDRRKVLRSLRRSWLTTLGGVLLRAGRHAEAVGRLKGALALSD